MDTRQRYYLLITQAHRPLMLLVTLMALIAVVAVGGLIADDRILFGVPIWEKPLKFALSIMLYGGVLALLIPMLDKGKRWANWFGTIIAVNLLAEMVIIVGQVVRGRASHFNAETALDSALFGIMGVSIAIVWFANLGIAVLLWRYVFADRVVGWAIRAGVVISLAGAAIGGTMVGPRDNLTENMIGAHSVGVADGGETIPFLGWSATGGDLRIGHFVGLHALQILPLVGLLLSRWGRSMPRLSPEVVRMRLMKVAAAGYVAVTVLVTWQAWRAEPLLHPSATIVLATLAVVGGVIIAAALAIRRPAPETGEDAERQLTGVAGSSEES